MAPRTRHIAVQQTFSGPMPPPEQLRQYNEVLPGAAERLLTLVKKQQSHRHSLETKLVDSDVRRTALGMWMGSAIAGLGLVTGCVLAFHGKGIEGGVIAGVPIGAIVSLFIYATRAKQREREARSATLAGR